MNEIRRGKLDRLYVSSRLGNAIYHMDGVDAEAIRNLFVQLFDRVEALEKRLEEKSESEADRWSPRGSGKKLYANDEEGRD